jgi:hypothetical protein
MAKKLGGEESIQGYFRKLLDENPKLIKQRNNDELYRRWLADHPDQKEVPDRVKQGLANLKSLLRRRARRRQRAGASNGHESTAPSIVVKPTARPINNLFRLEAQIDDALLTARSLDPQGLDDVIKLLRSARNKVIVRLAGD